MIGKPCLPIGLALAWSLAGMIAYGQAGPQAPVFKSPEVTSERTIIFRIFAPDAKAVTLRASDIPSSDHKPLELTKNDQGIWETTAGPVPAGAYRYTFVLDGVPVIDRRNPEVSESNTTSWSLVVVPGAEFVDAAQVPHGAVSAIHYYSTALNRMRRMHIYTPPGYEAGSAKYPVFYLLHGAGDSDDSWTSVGRANFILDNLIASKKAMPMIVVMPAGHTTREMRPPGSGQPARDEFAEDFVKDIVPYVEKELPGADGPASHCHSGFVDGWRPNPEHLNVASGPLRLYRGVQLRRLLARPAPSCNRGRPGAARHHSCRMDPTTRE